LYKTLYYVTPGLILVWVTVCGQVNHFVYNRPQAFYSSGVVKSSTGLSGWVKAGRVHLCQVTGDTVKSYMAGDAP